MLILLVLGGWFAIVIVIVVARLSQRGAAKREDSKTGIPYLTSNFFPYVLFKI